MSENEEAEVKEGVDSTAATPESEGRAEVSQEPIVQNINTIDETVDSQSYFLGEVPQPNLADPCAQLPLNSDRLIGAINVVEKLLFEVGLLIEEEVASIQKHQKRITFWEDRIEKNKAMIQKNEQRIKQNNTDALYDKKNRDYWYGRGEDVDIDYSHAEVSGREQDWAWLIKKYGFKNADGSEIDPRSVCVEELCNGESKNLSGEYKASGNRYENARKEKEAENSRLVRENAKLLNSNDQLQGYISAVYSSEIEPLQDGILLLKEFGMKLKELGRDEQSSYGDMRIWAEGFLNDFVKANPRVPGMIAMQFRKLASIPLPPEYC